MSYTPSEPTPVDVIRGLAGDTSNDPETEILADETYVAILGRFGVGAEAGTPTTTVAFYRAAAESLRRVMKVIADRPSSISSPGDGSISWSSRLDGLKLQVASLDALAAEAAADEQGGGIFGAPITIRSHFLTGSPDGGYEPW